MRDTAFSRVVRRAYDYRCAACGLRVILEGGLYIVDAAHLIPFAETHDDDPRNGIALCKNHHWAMDRNLIGPGTDRRWHITSSLDDRLEGQRELINLKGRSILLPHDPRYYPKDTALLWREQRIARPYCWRLNRSNVFSENAARDCGGVDFNSLLRYCGAKLVHDFVNFLAYRDGGHRQIDFAFAGVTAAL